MSTPRKKSKLRLSVFGAPVRRNGVLLKRSSGVLKRWQERAFELSGHYLRYYDPTGAPAAEDHNSAGAAGTHAPAGTGDGNEVRGVINLARLQHCRLEGLTLTLSFADSEGAPMKGADVMLRARTDEDAAAWAAELRECVLVEGQGRLSRKVSDAVQLAAFRGRTLSGVGTAGAARTPTRTRAGSGSASVVSLKLTSVDGVTSTVATAAGQGKKTSFFSQARSRQASKGGGGAGAHFPQKTEGGARDAASEETEQGVTCEQGEAEETEEDRLAAEEDAKVALSPITAGDSVFVVAGPLLASVAEYGVSANGRREIAATVLEVMGEASLLVLSTGNGGLPQLAKTEHVRPLGVNERAALAAPKRKKSVHSAPQLEAHDEKGRLYRKMSLFVPPPALLEYNPGVLNVQELIANNGMQGTLLKKGQELSRKWRPMYFVLVLSRDEIRYWSKKPMNREEARSKFQGVLFMKNARHIPLLAKPKYEHTFHLHAMQNHGSSKFNSERDFEFRANSATGMAKWVAAIDFAIEKANLDMDMDDEEDARTKHELKELMKRQEDLTERLAERLSHDHIDKSKHGKKFQNASGAMLEALQRQKKLAQQVRIDRVLSTVELEPPRSSVVQSRKVSAGRSSSPTTPQSGAMKSAPSFMQSRRQVPHLPTAKTSIGSMGLITDVEEGDGNT